MFICIETLFGGIKDEKLLTSIVLAGAMAFSLSGCDKEKEYQVEMENGLSCHAEFNDNQDYVWLNKGKKDIGIKIITRCKRDNCMPSVSYGVNKSESSNDVFEVINENGKFTTDSSWYKDPENRNEYKQLYSLIKKCESLLEQKYQRAF